MSHAQMLQSASLAVLKLQPADQDAVKCKVAVLLEGATFQEALEYIAKLGDETSFAFEKVTPCDGSHAEVRISVIQCFTSKYI